MKTHFETAIRSFMVVGPKPMTNFLSSAYMEKGGGTYYNFLDDFLLNYGLSFNLDHDTDERMRSIPYVSFLSVNVFNKERSDVDLSVKRISAKEAQQRLATYIISLLESTPVENFK